MEIYSGQFDFPVVLVVGFGYNGAAYSGFAAQKDPVVPTVQAELEQALRVLFRRDVPTTCAGRTDAGVHARRQVVSCVMERHELESTDADKLIKSLNALTPDDISVHKISYAEPGFSARFDAIRREYRYHIVTGSIPPLFLKDFCWWHRGPLDIASMQEAAKHLVGEHDFKSFCKATSSVGKNTMRNVESIDIYEDEQLGEQCIVVKVVGNAFLHSMVRTMVGTLVQVGSGQQDPSWVADVLAAQDRNAAGETAPAAGLTFWNVDYLQARMRDNLN